MDTKSTRIPAATGANDHPTRILIVAYYWPPMPGPGVQRWVKMVKYLSRLGYRCSVYCPAIGRYSARDESLLADLPEDLVTVRRPVLDPSLWRRGGARIQAGFLDEGHGKRQGLSRRLAMWIRANLFIPDAKMLWIRPSARFLTAWLREHPQDLIISSGPPHSLHLIARRLARRTKLPWLADFRDPWTTIDYMHHLPLTKGSHRRHQRLERGVLEDADAVVVVSQGMLEEYHPMAGERIWLIPNGFDEEDFTHVQGVKPEAPCTILHLGTLNVDRKPTTLLDTLEILQAEGRITPSELRVHQVGPADASIRAEVQRRGLGEWIDFLPPITHDRVPARLRKASALLLTINDTPTSQSILTGKIFEYLAARRPIICLGPANGEAAQLIAHLGVGHTFERGEAAPLAEYLHDLITKMQEGNLDLEGENIAPYTRRAQADEFARIINLLTTTRRELSGHTR